MVDPSKNLCYLAGPFFNHEQEHIIRRLEALMDVAGVPYFSPQKDAGKVEKGADPAVWQQVFDRNCGALGEMGWMLAVLPYALPDNAKLLLVTQPRRRPPECKGVHLPDTGTVWEMGFAAARQVPVVGFVPDEFELKGINVMLARGMSDVVLGYKELEDLLAGRRAEKRQLWEGLY